MQLMGTELIPSHNDGNQLISSANMKNTTKRFQLRASTRILVVLLAVSFYTATFADTSSQSSKGLALTGAEIIGYGPVVITIRKGKIEAISKDSAGENTDVIDLQGRYIVPGFIDSHVHLAIGYTPGQLTRGGIVAVVDLAAPLPYLASDYEPLHPVIRPHGHGNTRLPNPELGSRWLRTRDKWCSVRAYCRGFSCRQWRSCHQDTGGRHHRWWRNTGDAGK